jgi:hypothetical protein
VTSVRNAEVPEFIYAGAPKKDASCSSPSTPTTTSTLLTVTGKWCIVLAGVDPDVDEHAANSGRKIAASCSPASNAESTTPRARC